MKKILYGFLALLACVSLTRCKTNDFLSVSSPNKMDDSFVTYSVSETFKTLAISYRTMLSVAGGGNYNWNDSASDVEYYPEYNSGNGRVGYLDVEGTPVDQASGLYGNLFVITERSSRVAKILAEKDEVKNASGVTDWTQLYGEAWTMWAYGYIELVKHFGDVPFGHEDTIIDEVEGFSITSRYEILDAVIAKLKDVEGKMYYLGEGGINAERMSRTFAHALIAEANLLAGDYQTIRLDANAPYSKGDFEILEENSTYECATARIKTWQSYYKEAQTYFRDILTGSAKGTAHLITSDDRGLGNPFQRNFQYIMDMEVSPESYFEVGNQSPLQSERPYSQGRPSDGATKNAAPCKVFSGIRVIPTAYYQLYEDGDLRWDASIVVTGSDGKGSEALVNMNSGSRLSGGIPTNKWDINKMKTPYVTACRNSGMNFQFYRVPTAMLKLAMVDVQLGDSGEALSLLNQLRERAGVAPLNSAGVDEVILETKRETVGEGDIKYMELRAGKFGEMGKAMRTELKEVIAGLEKDGYYTFPNGRTISCYVWTKLVDISGKNVAVNTYNRVDGDPVRSPGWRGNYDYTTTSSASAVKGDKHNLAIKGLFEYIDPQGAEAAALEADGYTKVDWAIGMVNGKAGLWDYNMLSGIDKCSVPRHYHPLPLITIQQSRKHITNGYGLPNE